MAVLDKRIMEGTMCCELQKEYSLGYIDAVYHTSAQMMRSHGARKVSTLTEVDKEHIIHKVDIMITMLYKVREAME